MAKDNSPAVSAPAAPAAPAAPEATAVDPPAPDYVARIAELEKANAELAANLTDLRAENTLVLSRFDDLVNLHKQAVAHIKKLENEREPAPRSTSNKMRLRAKMNLGLCLNGVNVDVKIGEIFEATRDEMDGLTDAHAEDA